MKKNIGNVLILYPHVRSCRGYRSEWKSEQIACQLHGYHRSRSNHAGMFKKFSL